MARGADATAAATSGKTQEDAFLKMEEEGAEERGSPECTADCPSPVIGNGDANGAKNDGVFTVVKRGNRKQRRGAHDDGTKPVNVQQPEQLGKRFQREVRAFKDALASITRSLREEKHSSEEHVQLLTELRQSITNKLSEARDCAVDSVRRWRRNELAEEIAKTTRLISTKGGEEANGVVSVTKKDPTAQKAYLSFLQTEKKSIDAKDFTKKFTDSLSDINASIDKELGKMTTSASPDNRKPDVRRTQLLKRLEGLQQIAGRETMVQFQESDVQSQELKVTMSIVTLLFSEGTTRSAVESSFATALYRNRNDGGLDTITAYALKQSQIKECATFIHQIDKQSSLEQKTLPAANAVFRGVRGLTLLKGIAAENTIALVRSGKISFLGNAENVAKSWEAYETLLKVPPMPTSQPEADERTKRQHSVAVNVTVDPLHHAALASSPGLWRSLLIHVEKTQVKASLRLEKTPILVVASGAEASAQAAAATVQEVLRTWVTEVVPVQITEDGLPSFGSVQAIVGMVTQDERIVLFGPKETIAEARVITEDIVRRIKQDGETNGATALSIRGWQRPGLTDEMIASMQERTGATIECQADPRRRQNNDSYRILVFGEPEQKKMH